MQWTIPPFGGDYAENWIVESQEMSSATRSQDIEAGAAYQSTQRRARSSSPETQQNELRYNQRGQSDARSAVNNDPAAIRRNSFSRSRTEHEHDLFEDEGELRVTHTVMTMQGPDSMGTRWKEDDAYATGAVDINGDIPMSD